MGNFIATTLTQYLTETIKNNKFYIDKYGKCIVYDDGEYQISVDDENNATYIVLYHKEYIKGEEKMIKCGYLSASINRYNPFKNYLSINSIEIDPKHRNLGYGTKMYQALIDFSSENIKGIYSYLPNRINKKQIPKMYKKFKSVIDGDYEYIEFK